MSKSLNRVIVEEYLKDLRSGKFKQCRVVLHDGEAHCAIGVFELTYKRITGEYLDYKVYTRFKDVVGIHDYKIFDKNDNGMLFSEIADYIEQHSPVMEKENV